MTGDTSRLPAGVRLMVGRLDLALQQRLLDEIRAVIRRAPLYVPTMPRTGKELSVRMTNCGCLGWMTDQAGGYRYQATHPVTDVPWPPIPDSLLDLWREVAPAAAPPEACLVNVYGAGARMGSHRDADESDLTAPVVSVSLGDDAIFHVGGLRRGDPQGRSHAALGRRLCLGRALAVGLPRHRSGLAGNQHAAAGGRADQPDAAAGLPSLTPPSQRITSGRRLGDRVNSRRSRPLGSALSRRSPQDGPVWHLLWRRRPWQAATPDPR